MADDQECAWSTPRVAGFIMRRFADLVRKHPIAVFVVLAYALSWTLVPFGGLLGCGPFLAAMTVLWMLEGRRGMRALIPRMLQWRIGWVWYALAVLVPAGLAVLAAVITVAIGAPKPTTAQLGAWTEIPFTVALFLIVPLFGPWEEPGFRGFALSRLQVQHSLLAAALLVGVIHVGFHIPLFVTGDIPVSDVVFIMAASVVVAWLVIGSGGSVLVAMVMHAVNNAVSGEFISPLFSGDDAEVLGWVRALLWCVIALAVIAVAGRQFRAAPGDRTDADKSSASPSAPKSGQSPSLNKVTPLPSSPRSQRRDISATPHPGAVPTSESIGG